ncbi:thioester domain-containing protein [Nakamurella endophytica]|uniref:TQXA domain-containing protein n=1 Tax=Nakamurella endophytica TaxID=1748367 RepID=A0A917SS79_9ACTN|nr:thioester domain-containing protein [Nakamurella endophytica]GGL93710.1 hypothetical protein GCM10011594_11990 [Nakamurella endophytica]
MPNRVAPPRLVLLLCALLAALGLAVSAAPAATAVPVPPGAGDPGPVAGDTTELVMTGFGHGRGLIGGVPDGTPFDPLAGYPRTSTFSGPLPRGFIERNEDFAGTITAASADGSLTSVLYCIDLATTTYPGIGYRIGSWDQATVPNVGYVARTLTTTYPAVPGQPAGLSGDDERAAAVQAAIWFFTDDYVLDRADPLRGAVADLVAAVLEAGRLDPPPLPELSLDPTFASTPAGDAAGPFTVHSDLDETVTVRSAGATMSTDADGDRPLAQDAQVGDGQQIYLRSTGAGSARLRATGVQTVRTGIVYLYDGNTPGVGTAQKLILATTARVQVRAASDAQFLDPGSVQVSIVITGDAAGRQGAATVVLSCRPGQDDVRIDVPPGATGTSTRIVRGIPPGSFCTVSEPDTGATPAVAVSVAVDPPGRLTVPDGGTVQVTVTDTVTAVMGSVQVDTAIAGPAAAEHGAALVLVSCAGQASVSIPIPAGETTVEPVTVTAPVGTLCTVTEPTDGSTDTVRASVHIDPTTVAVPPGDPATVAVRNEYQVVPPPTTPTTTPTTTPPTTPSPTSPTSSVTPTTAPSTTTTPTTITGSTSSSTVGPTSTATAPTTAVSTSTATPTTTATAAPTTVTVTTTPTTPTTPHPHVLPDTGVPAGLVPAAAAASLAILIGIGLLVPGRRRRSARHR